MPPLPGLTDFLPYSHPTAGAVGYRMPPATRAYGLSALRLTPMPLRNSWNRKPQPASPCTGGTTVL
jgi:hypothetical protein